MRQWPFVKEGKSSPQMSPAPCDVAVVRLLYRESANVLSVLNKLNGMYNLCSKTYGYDDILGILT
eukprot:5026647-Prorocentrum_lima.AAC.1